MSILGEAQKLGFYCMIPTGAAGPIVKETMEKAAEAEAEGNIQLAEELMEYAMAVDATRW